MDNLSATLKIVPVASYLHRFPGYSQEAAKKERKEPTLPTLEAGLVPPMF